MVSFNRLVGLSLDDVQLRAPAWYPENRGKLISNNALLADIIASMAEGIVMGRAR
jgi:hypothetical protein